MDNKDPKMETSPASGLWSGMRCSFLDNAGRCLPARLRSLEEIFVITMQAPGLRDIVEISFYNDDRQITHQVEATVTDVSYHPSDVTLCGFTAMVTRPETMFPYPPPSANLTRVDVEKVNVPRGEIIVKRRDPRVRTRVPAAVHLLGKNLSATILNLSMSGALLGFGRELIPLEMSVGALFRLDAYDAHGDISLCAKAEVVRLIGVGRPTNAGIRFIDMDSDVRSCIEGIILNEVFYQDLLSSENRFSESAKEILRYD